MCEVSAKRHTHNALAYKPQVATMPASYTLRNKPKAHHTTRTQTGIAGNTCRLSHFALA